MNNIVRKLPTVVLSLCVAAGQVESQDKPITPAEQFKMLGEAFFDTKLVFSFNAKTDEERNEAVARVVKLQRRFLDLAENNPKDAIALDALVQVVHVEFWLDDNAAHPGDGKESLQVKAIDLLLRDHGRSDRLGEACRMVQHGFRQECETFLRTVLKMSPHQNVRAQASLGLAQFMNARLHRLDLVKQRPELAKRNRQLYGEDYLDQLQSQDRAEAAKDVETLFVRAAERYGDVKLPRGATVSEQVKKELFEIRHLTVGKEPPDIEGADQNGKRFKLTDYRGKVVLLYFWSEF